MSPFKFCFEIYNFRHYITVHAGIGDAAGGSGGDGRDEGLGEGEGASLAERDSAVDSRQVLLVD